MCICTYTLFLINRPRFSLVTDFVSLSLSLPSPRTSQRIDRERFNADEFIRDIDCDAGYTHVKHDRALLGTTGPGDSGCAQGLGGNYQRERSGGAEEENKNEGKSAELQRKIDYGPEDYKSASFVVDQSISTSRTLLERRRTNVERMGK